MVALHVRGFVFRFAKQVLVEFDGGFVALEFCIRMSIVILSIRGGCCLRSSRRIFCATDSPSHNVYVVFVGLVNVMHVASW